MQAARTAITVLFIVLPGVVLFPVWPLAGLGAGEDDILYYFPSRQFLYESAQAGQWPWINPWVGLGRPYLADPQSALFYPPTWLFAAFPTVWAYPALLWAHYTLALAGMYRLLRWYRFQRVAAVFGAIAFGLGGFLLAHRAHYTLIQASAWIPLVWWAWERVFIARARQDPTRAPEALRSPDDSQAIITHAGTGGTLPAWLLAVLITALQCFAGHIQLAALTALGGVVYFTAKTGVNRAWFGFAFRYITLWIAVAGLFAVQWVPTFFYLALCSRGDRSYFDFTENSWWPTSALTWVAPMLFGQRTPNFFDQPYWGPSHQCEQLSYFGIAPLLLAVVALRPGWRGDPRRRPWVILLIFALLTALGCFGPICPLLYLLPGSNLFRVPARALVLVQLAAAVLAAVSLHDLGPLYTPARARLRAALNTLTARPLRLTLLLVAAPIGLALLTAMCLPGEARTPAWSALRWSNPAIYVPIAIAAMSIVALAFVTRGWRAPARRWLLVPLLIVDLAILGWNIDVPRGPRTAAELLTPRDSTWLEPIVASGLRLWVVTPRQGGRPGEYVDSVEKCVANTNILRRVPTLTDYGPLQPREFERRFGFRPWGESERALELLDDSAWMPSAGVGWILLCAAELPAPKGCMVVTTTAAGWRLFRNPAVTSMVRFDTAVGSARLTTDGPAGLTALAIQSSPASTAQTPFAETGFSGPRLLFSRLALPGWTARTTGGDALIVERPDALTLAVRVPPAHQVELRLDYFPPGLWEGGAIAGVTLLVLISLGMYARSRGGQDSNL